MSHSSWADPSTPHSPSRWSLLWYLLPVSYVLLWIPAIGDGYFSGLVFANDALQQITPFWWVHGGGRMEDSLVYEFMYSLPPLGLRALYFLLTLVASPVIASQCVALALAGAVVFFCVRIGSRTHPAIGASLVYLLLRHHRWMLFGGLPRGFGMPVALMFLYFLMTRNERGIWAALLAGALFYPPVFALGLVAYGLFLTWRLLTASPRDWAPLLRLAAVTVVCVAVLLPSAFKSERIGSLVTIDEAARMPEWNERGRFPYLHHPAPWGQIRTEPARSLEPFARNRSPAIVRVNKDVVTWIALALTAAGLVLLIRGPYRDLAPPLLCWSAASVLLFYASEAVAFRLYIPERMLAFGLRLVVPFVLCIGFGSLGPFRWKGREIATSHIVLFGLILTVFVVWRPGIPVAQFKASYGLEDARARAGFYQAIRALPPRSRIAGDPVELDSVILATGQDAYFTFETAQPLYNNYYREISRRIRAFHPAYFATDPKILAAFLRDERIDYLLVNRSHFGPDGIAAYRLFEPYDTEVRAAFGSVEPVRFVLSSTNLSGVVCDIPPFVLLDAPRFAAGIALPRAEKNSIMAPDRP
jgi:hypothetical protein